jgi:hypothetical protein
MLASLQDHGYDESLVENWVYQMIKLHEPPPPFNVLALGSSVAPNVRPAPDVCASHLPIHR